MLTGQATKETLLVTIPIFGPSSVEKDGGTSEFTGFVDVTVQASHIPPPDAAAAVVDGDAKEFSEGTMVVTNIKCTNLTNVETIMGVTNSFDKVLTQMHTRSLIHTLTL